MLFMVLNIISKGGKFVVKSIFIITNYVHIYYIFSNMDNSF